MCHRHYTSYYFSNVSVLPKVLVKNGAVNQKKVKKQYSVAAKFFFADIQLNREIKVGIPPRAF
jgi:hypothetical protein